MEGIYEIADYLEIECLRRKALDFLEATCTVNNIAARAFGNFAKTHQEVARIYDKYFITHWEQVRKSSVFEEFFNMEDPIEYRRIHDKLRKMIRNDI